MAVESGTTPARGLRFIPNMTTQSQSLRLADRLARHPYAWPGGYPLYAITSDGAALCHRCAASERASIGTTTGTDGWNVVAIDANWGDPELYCDHCGGRIESAYAEDETTQSQEVIA